MAQLELTDSTYQRNSGIYCNTVQWKHIDERQLGKKKEKNGENKEKKVPQHGVRFVPVHGLQAG